MTLTSAIGRPSTVASSAPALGSRWLHVVSHLDPKYGGVSAVVPQLCRSLAGASCRAELAAFCLPGEFDSMLHDGGNGVRALAVSGWPASRLTWLRDAGVRRRFRGEIEQADGVHIHGLWEQSTLTASRVARSLGKPYVVSAHGMLEPWALRNKRWKKVVYAALTERSTVQGAACLHALTQAEAANYRAFGARGPIAVIPNGVDVPGDSTSAMFLEAFPHLRGKRLVLFLGRIHYKKGLDLLIEAWSTVAQRWPDAHLVLAGPDSEGTQARVEASIAEHGLGERVTFTGMLREGMKWSGLRAANCFVLPSYSEGLSTAVLEAMGVGLPVIVTRHCNLPEVTTHKTGWEIESNTGELALSLDSFLGNSDATNQAMGERGRQLVHDQYGWPSVARRMSEVYRWVAGGPLPVSVDILRADVLRADTR